MARVTARAEVLNYVAVHPGRNAAKVAEKARGGTAARGQRGIV